MKRFKFLVPIGLAAASIIGGNVIAQPTQEAPVTELQIPDQQNLPERTLLMKVTDQALSTSSGNRMSRREDCKR